MARPRKKPTTPKPATHKRQPPEGFITASEATSILGNKMLYKYVEKGIIKRHKPETLKQGYYRRSDVEAIKRSEGVFFDRGEIVPLREKNNTVFARADEKDMEGVYKVAAELFPHGTTSAEARKPLIAKCPDGNYIVSERDEIVAYIHLQPLKTEVMRKFLAGKIRGKDITANDLDCFEPGKSVDILVKSMGATRKYGDLKSHFYTQRLLLGTMNALTKLGEQGIIIRKIYATSETETGIALSLHARMKAIRRLKVSNARDGEPPRYAFELEVATSDLPMLQPYKQAIAKWKANNATN